MRHRIAVASLAAVTLFIGACEGGDGGASRLATEPTDGNAGKTGSVHYVTTVTAAVRDPRTQRLQDVRLSPATPTGARASVVAGTSTRDAMQLPASLSGFGPGAGYARATFDDQAAHHHTLILLYSRIGGPPVAMQHYIDGALASVSAYTWQRVATGWVRTRSVLQAVKGGTLYGSFTTTSVPVSSGGGGPPQTVRLEHTPSVGPLGRVVGGVAYGLARALAPQDVSAQYSRAFGTCLQQWLKYAAAGALVAGYAALIVEVPILTPIIAMQFAGALALLAAAEDALLDCVLSNQPARWPFSGTGAAGGSAGGAGGAGSSDCLEGSYAAHCTTAFTL